jgi:uncharacterized membrane protein YdjX (TVP38/TMEM64 family)
MAKALERDGRRSGKAFLKAMFLVVFIISAILLIHFTSVRTYLAPVALARFLDGAGFWAPVVFIGIYSAGVCLFIPAALMTGLGAAIFGPYWGYVYVYLGAILGASASFIIGRSLGRDFVASLVGEKFKKFDEAIERNGFSAVLYLRLIYSPFSALSFGMGLTKVRFSDYFWGTALGILVETFIFTLFIGTVKEIWTSGEWNRLAIFKVSLSLVLFVASLFVPKLLRKVKKKEKQKEVACRIDGACNEEGGPSRHVPFID